MMQAVTAETAPLVLLVDAHADTRELYRCALEARGFRVATEEHAADALYFAQHQHPAAIVTELVLPEISGATFARALHDLPATAETPVIALTGMARGRDIDAAKRAGCTDVLLKPCLPDELASALRRVIEAGWTARQRSSDAGARATMLRARSERILLQSAVIRSRRAGQHSAHAPVACPSCGKSLEWRDHQSAQGSSFDYFHPCPSGCGEFYFTHSRRLMRLLRP